MKKLNICFITQKYDEDDPYRSNVVEWINKISQNKKVDNVHILTRYKSNITKLGNCSFSNIQSKNKIKSLILFYFEIFKQIPKKSVIFIHMGGPYGLNLFLFKIFFKTKVYQWWAHPILSFSNKIGFYLSIDKLFTCSESSFPLKSEKKIIVGHGININKFPLRKNGNPHKNSLVTASRLTFRKNIHEMINLVQFLKEKYKIKINLTVYGSPLSNKDKIYKKFLIALIKQYKLEESVNILPAVEHSKLHKYYENHNVYLNFSETALDKSVLEAMSTGIPVLSCNPCLAETINDEYIKNLITFDSLENFTTLSKKVIKFLNLKDKEFNFYKSKSNQFIKANHSIKRLTGLIIEKIYNDI